MLDGHRCVRAYRPSVFVQKGEFEEDNVEQIKLERIRLYMQRAAAGEPLFDADGPELEAVPEPAHQPGEPQHAAI